MSKWASKKDGEVGSTQHVDIGRKPERAVGAKSWLGSNNPKKHNEEKRNIQMHSETIERGKCYILTEAISRYIYWYGRNIQEQQSTKGQDFRWSGIQIFSTSLSADESKW